MMMTATARYDPVIRALTAEDLDAALRLSTIAGWNQQIDDWRMLLRLAPAGAFAALIDARVVGTSIGIDYRGFAWVAMMLVDPNYRRRGVGRRLLEAALDAVPSQLPVRLDATPLGRPLYQRYGFEDEAVLSRHVTGDSHRSVSVSEGSSGSGEVRPLMAADLKIVIAEDEAIFGGSRGALLEWQLRDAPKYAYVAQTGGGGPTHYCLGRPGRLCDQIGPVVAGDERIAQALVSAALAAAGDQPVLVDAFDSQSAFRLWLTSRGLVAQRAFVRMRRPANSRNRATRTETRESALAEFAIVGPEFA